MAKPKEAPNKEALLEDFEHADKTMFSCGSLAPKLKRGGGCMDHGFSRPQEMWEMSDGAVHLIRELSAYEKHHELVGKYV